jgi:hypothetical protein
MNMSDFLSCFYCQAPVSVNRNRETRQGSISLQGVGHFCSRQCARVFVTLKPTQDFPAENVYGFSNPPLTFRVMAQRWEPGGIENTVVAESHHESHAIRMASAYPHRAIVTNWHSKRVFDNGKDIPGIGGRMSLFRHITRVWCHCGHRTLVIRMKHEKCSRCREEARRLFEQMERDDEQRRLRGYLPEELERI